MRRLFAVLLSLGALCHCSQVDEDFGKIPEIPPELRGGRASVKKNEPPARLVAAGVDPASLTIAQGGVKGLPSESELIFTNPDDVDGSESAIEGLFQIQKKDWLESHSIAKKYALLESKPLLILFTDSPGPQSSGSPSAARLERELVARLDFSKWAAEHFIRLKLDFNVRDRQSADSKKQAFALKKEKYLKTLQKRYKVKGFPAMMVVAADGTVVQTIRGYRSGTSEYVWGLLKTGLVLNDERQQKFEEKLAKKGYRRWKGQNDNRVLARLASYKDGELLLIAPNGVRYQTSESHLSPEDILWIEEQKEKRKR